MTASFRSTTNPTYPRSWGPNDKILTDPLSGAPVGIQNQNANGFDGQWSPVPVTASQIANPSAAMLADTNSTYQLNVAPYTRYQSNGAYLVSLGPSPEVVVPPGFNELLYAPLTIIAPTVLIVQASGGTSGSITVITKPA